MIKSLRRLLCEAQIKWHAQQAIRHRAALYAAMQRGRELLLVAHVEGIDARSFVRTGKGWG